MKKTIKIVLLFIICVVLATTCVKAEDEACKITLSADKTTLKPGDEVTITLLMEDITKTTGIFELISILDLPEDIFEIQLVEDEDLSSEIEGLGLGILYSGAKDTDSSIENPWYLLLEEEAGIYGLLGSTAADPQIESQIVGKIKLKVKENANSTIATVRLVETEVSDAEDVQYAILDSEIELQITASSESVTDDDYDIIGDSTANQTEKENKVQTENKATGEAPYTGVEDYIPFIFVGIIISIMAYINYQKYKNI